MPLPKTFVAQRHVKSSDPNMLTAPSTPPVPPGMMKHKAAAAWLCVSDRFLTEEVRLQRVRCAKFGKLLRYDIKDLMAYAEARKIGGLNPICTSHDVHRVVP